MRHSPAFMVLLAACGQRAPVTAPLDVPDAQQAVAAPDAASHVLPVLAADPPAPSDAGAPPPVEEPSSPPPEPAPRSAACLRAVASVKGRRCRVDADCEPRRIQKACDDGVTTLCTPTIKWHLDRALPDGHSCIADDRPNRP